MLRRDERWVGVREGHVPEPGPRRVAAADRAGHFASRPTGDVAVLGQVPRPGGVLVIAHRVVELPSGVALIAQENVVVVPHSPVRPTFLGEDDVIKAGSRPLRKHVQFARRKRLVTGLAKALGDRRHGGHFERRLKRAVAVTPRALPGQEASPSRDADGALAVGIRESPPASCEFVERRRLDIRMPGTAKQMSRPVIRRDQQNVRSISQWRFLEQGRFLPAR